LYLLLENGVPRSLAAQFQSAGTQLGLAAAVGACGGKKEDENENCDFFIDIGDAQKFV
jgi:hypothetical protein